MLVATVVCTAKAQPRLVLVCKKPTIVSVQSEFNFSYSAAFNVDKSSLALLSVYIKLAVKCDQTLTAQRRKPNRRPCYSCLSQQRGLLIRNYLSGVIGIQDQLKSVGCAFEGKLVISWDKLHSILPNSRLFSF